MYGRIGRMVARAGQRDELIEILRESSADLPGCRSYVVARDAEDQDGLWITEVWEDRESHRASLELPAVRDAIARGRPLIASVGRQVETEPVLDADTASPAP